MTEVAVTEVAMTGAATAEAPTRLSDEAAVNLLRDLVAIPSVSGNEGSASRYLVQQMCALGFERARVDEVGNAVGEIGDPQAQRLLVLLGHIDTVPGDIPVRIEKIDGRDVLFGRGSVDAKGPLSAFVAAAARLGSDWARNAGVRVVVAGAVEEESATSRGARFLRQYFLGQGGDGEPIPDACIIGEPSGAERVTLGYKGRLLATLEGRRPARHTAGPDPGIGAIACDLWSFIERRAREHNQGLERAFDQLQPSIRTLATDASDGLEERLRAIFSFRLPPGFDAEGWQDLLVGWLESHEEHQRGSELNLRFAAYEPAWHGSRRTPLVRAFSGAIRSLGPAVRPGFLVKTGTSDMNVVGPHWRCPILAYGPGDSALDHTPREHIVVEEYLRAIRVLEEVLPRWAAAPS